MLLLGIIVGVLSWFVLKDVVRRGPEVWAATIAAVLVYLVTFLDKSMGLNKLNRITQQVVFVMMPPLALIFLVLGTFSSAWRHQLKAGPWGQRSDHPVRGQATIEFSTR